jgi:hypothetical protein
MEIRLKLGNAKAEKVEIAAGVSPFNMSMVVALTKEGDLTL